MAKAIKPTDVSAQVNWDISPAREFAAALLEDVNDHELSLAIAAFGLGDTDLACEFLQLGAAVRQKGQLTHDLRDRLNWLLDRLRQAAGE